VELTAAALRQAIAQHLGQECVDRLDLPPGSIEDTDAARVFAPLFPAGALALELASVTIVGAEVITLSPAANRPLAPADDHPRARRVRLRRRAAPGRSACAGDPRRGLPAMTPAARESAVLAVRSWFGLRPAEARVLIALFEAGDTHLACPALASRADVRVGSIGFLVFQLREALEAEAIDRERGAGYRLTDIGRAEIEEAVAQMRNALAEVA